MSWLVLWSATALRTLLLVMVVGDKTKMTLDQALLTGNYSILDWEAGGRLMALGSVEIIII